MWKRVAILGGVLAVVVVVMISNDFCFSERDDGCPGDWPDPAKVRATVLVTTRDVEAGEEIGPVIEVEVPGSAVIDAGASSEWQLVGRTTTMPIGKGEQIPKRYLCPLLRYPAGSRSC